jgi:glycosyltransferase involved in cell wall biosynthesis
MINVGFLLNFPIEYKGGINYLKNLFYAIDKYYKNKINIVLFIPQNISEEYVTMFSPYSKVIRTPILQRNTLPWLISRIGEKHLGFDILIYQLLKKHKIHCVSHSNYVFPFKSVRSINWIPDFQYLHYPQLWSQKQLNTTKKLHKKLIKNSDLIVLSSNNAKNDFKNSYPGFIDKVRVMHFVSQPDIVQFTERKNDLNSHINGKYFYLPNQFWSHKNHLTVFKSMALLKSKGVNVTLVTTGLMHDYRNNNHIDELKSFVKENNIEENVDFLGLIPYSDVLQLIADATAVINPSFFEGWSSTVEESKSIGKLLILSDIEVHREQNPDNVIFFNPTDEQNLAEILEKVWNNDQLGKDKIPKEKIVANLEERTKEFALRFNSILSELELY